MQAMRKVAAQRTAREVPDTGPGPMSWINAQVRAGALEQQTPDLERVLGRPAETVISRVLGRHTPQTL
ncbi:hypothetical protein GCM10010517_49640 [Streptosporangium fragile]|uniref:Uncharacterized protein n=1 Tax=Streptosporangium fragile TaxID=46186 RepID=A0ABN3W1R7_9ACTN